MYVHPQSPLRQFDPNTRNLTALQRTTLVCETEVGHQARHCAPLMMDQWPKFSTSRRIYISSDTLRFKFTNDDSKTRFAVGVRSLIRSRVTRPSLVHYSLPTPISFVTLIAHSSHRISGTQKNGTASVVCMCTYSQRCITAKDEVLACLFQQEGQPGAKCVCGNTFPTFRCPMPFFVNTLRLGSSFPLLPPFAHLPKDAQTRSISFCRCRRATLARAPRTRNSCWISSRIMLRCVCRDVMGVLMFGVWVSL